MGTQIFGDISSAWKQISTDYVRFMSYLAKIVFDHQRYMYLQTALK